MSEVFNFILANDDITVRFACPNHSHRIQEIIKNLCIDTTKEESITKKLCRYTLLRSSGFFQFNGEKVEGTDVRHEAVFFENTEYPLIVRGNKGKEITDLSMSINDRCRSDEGTKSTIISEDGELYGAINFHNQIGLTDFTFHYRIKGETQPKQLKFVTEVLSYKLDYRSDLKRIIADIEHEYAMLSASFLKDTYLNMRRKGGKSTDLVWWQIFKSCYNDIIRAAKQIISRPKQMLQTIERYERAERLSFLPPELENEYLLHRDNPARLYCVEDSILSHDTIENRFLKHVITEMSRKFSSIKEHITTALHLDNPSKIDDYIDIIERELTQIKHNPFFRGIGIFKGFTQDNLVMKQANGYKTIMEKWIELQQGYELEEGLRKLEVKDISTLYEIWCFIKVKNIVSDTLRDLGIKALATANGRALSNDFIPQLIYGGCATFIDENRVEIASVSYNHQIYVYGKKLGMGSITTIQRPDIMLRISNTTAESMKYTYIFDAKYRIDNTKIGGQDVPPEDAINQMHRYRDAIYYTEKGFSYNHLRKEITGGYVLFPGIVNADTLREEGDYCYQKSNLSIGIGAFPLRPGDEIFDANGNPYFDQDSSEQALRRQIRKWLEDEHPLKTLLDSSIPQKGLEYSYDRPSKESTSSIS